MKKYAAKAALVMLSLFFVYQVYADEEFNKRFHEFLKEAPALKDISLKKAEEHKDEFKKNLKGYTDNPEQTSHYNEDKLDTIKMEQQAARESAPNAEESPRENAGQIVSGSFKKRLVYKIDKNDTDVAKAKEIENNPEKNAKITFEKRTGCKKEKTTKCEEALEEKRCEEQVRALVKVCEKVPKITTSIKDVVYPGCMAVAIAQGASARCPGGYSEILYRDMLRGPLHDDVRICTRAVNVGESLECLGGYVVYGFNNNVANTGRVTVPKKLHARARVSNVYQQLNHPCVIAITIINEATGARVQDNVSLSDGQGFDLPYSETQDQTFVLHSVPRSTRFMFSEIYFVGVITFYVDHTYREKVASLESWLETNCNDS